MPASEVQLFKQNITYARDLISTASALRAQLTSVINTDDLLRSALVQGVSAFDHFVHEEVRARMIAIQSGQSDRTKGFDRFRVSLAAVNLALKSGGVGWLEQEIREQHGYLSFQQPDKVADAFRLVSDVSLWAEVAKHLGLRPEDVKRQLKLIADRRNKIAHEADTDPTPPRSRYPIGEKMVRDSVDFLEAVVDAIAAVL
ncbi:HEPN domain-containing protein [Streptomyces sp. OfavH-34-F]|uniref:HEPN domain-containing protein n=1 Tax=Streptomyces sp. OfavH-34-F TaxID=2917760 RepID=UPI001EF17D66|nr:HEPN domain-containing protein [Streptomyces sp. OfavH-34-F]MCG7524813.1 HEPN domain-containing protein [Streptomyces sp. OfavH-34-F]